MSWPELLFETLTRRAMPETVAAAIVSDPASAREFTAGQLRLLQMAAGARGLVSLSSMPGDFTAHPGCARAAAVALEVHGVHGWDGDPSSFADLTALTDQLGDPLGWVHGMDWKADRLAKERRRAAALTGAFPAAAVPHRSYNKRVRVLRNLWQHAEAMNAAQRLRRLIMVSRSGFACDLERSRFEADRAAAAFIAYLTARKNLRREFTLSGRDNPVDQVAEMLLARCEANGDGTDWAMIADVWPRPQVLRHLGGGQLGQLLGRWWAVMRDCSVILAGLWSEMNTAQAAWADRRGHGYDPDSHIHGRPCTWCGRGPGAAAHGGLPREVDRAQMIVRAGMDSDGWNGTAAAYNAARAAWIGCAVASGADAMLVPYLPGKVMRVMAADLAYWHQAAGGGVHPDTRVWAALPLPWDVIAGLEECAMTDVEAACAAAGLDAAASGWSAPLLAGQAAAFRPTPELVHGVAVADPAWAGLLRKAGVFSGKTAGEDRAVEAALLRAAAAAQGVITGELPVYSGGTYLGTSHQAGP